MSTNPFKFMGGLVLEIAAVVAVLSLLPAFGTRDPQAVSLSQSATAVPNQVFFDAQSARRLDLVPTAQPMPMTSPLLTPPPAASLSPAPALQGNDFSARPTPPAVWSSDYAPRPSAADQRFVEDVLDHSSQRVLDTAARVFERGEELLPTDLRARPQAANEAPRLAMSDVQRMPQQVQRAPLTNMDRGELIELPSAQPAREADLRPTHPSFAETYPRQQLLPPTSEPVARPQYRQPLLPPTNSAYQPSAAYQPTPHQPSAYYPSNYTPASPAPANYAPSAYAPTLPPQQDVNAGRPSYYSRPQGVQTAEPHVRRYEDRY